MVSSVTSNGGVQGTAVVKTAADQAAELRRKEAKNVDNVRVEPRDEISLSDEAKKIAQAEDNAKAAREALEANREETLAAADKRVDRLL